MTAAVSSDVSAPAEPAPAPRRSFEYERSPLDVLHALTAVAALGIVVLLEFVLPTTLAAIEVDLVSAFERLPRWLDIGVIVAAQLAAFIAQIALLVFLLRRPRRRLFVMSAAAVVVTVALFSLLDRWLDREAPEALNATLPGPQLAGEAWPATLWLGCMAAVLTIASTVMRRRWQVTAWTLFGLLVVLRLVTGTTLTIDVGAAIALGITVGAVTLLAVGRPDVHPTTDDVAAALRALQVDEPVVHAASVDARGSTPYFVDAANGRRVFAKVLTPRERYADIMFRLYRRVRYRGLGDERPFSTLRRAVEHEAMLSLMALDLGVRTPRLVGVARVGEFDALLLSTESIDGRSLDRVPAERMTDDVVRQAWTAVRSLHERQIAHRDLRLANVFLDDDDQVWIIDFGFGEAACSQEQKDGDVAELLASSAAVVGADRAVSAALQVIGPDALISASARLEPQALSTATRGAAKSIDGGLRGLRDTIATATGREVAAPVQLERVSGKTILTLVVIGAVVYFLIPQLADIPGLVRQIADVNAAWIAPIVIASLATYAGAALGLASSVINRVPYLPALGVALAGSFVNRLAPVKVAGAALNIRFLQKRGVTPLTAIAGAGLIAAAGAISHIVVTLASILAAGRQSDGLPFELPKISVIIGVVAAVLIVVGVLLWIPRTAQLIKAKVLPAIVSTRDSVKGLAQTPHKVVGLFAGGLIVPISYATCLYFSVEAFGGGLGLAQVAVVFLTVGTVAGAAPTPGGVGVVEAALIGGLSALGLPTEQALASVFLYRLATFWLPVLPGWISFTLLQRAEEI